MNKQVLDLFKKFINNQCNKEELSTILKLIQEEDYENDFACILDELEGEINLDNAGHLLIRENNDELLERINSTIENNVSANNAVKFYQKRVFLAAAVFLAVSTIGIYFYLNNNQLYKKQELALLTIKNVKPESYLAYLTLASGKRIPISESDLRVANEGGVELIKDKDNQLVYKTDEDASQIKSDVILYNKIEIPKGKKIELNLPDGSKVWLNGGTSLRYPISFGGLKVREVELVGEAYFEIVHNEKVHFKVYVDKNIIQVLGTKFNVNSYKNEPYINTTLLQGSVKIFANVESPDSKSVTINPGEQASIGGNKIKINQVDTEEIMAWKDDNFIFKNQDFESVMRSISRWYDLDVVYENIKPINVRPGGWISRKNRVEEVLEMIETTSKIKFKIEGRKIIIKN